MNQDMELSINSVDIVRTDENYVYISGGLDPNHKIVMSAVSSPYNGMPVRTLESTKVSESDTPAETTL